MRGLIIRATCLNRFHDNETDFYCLGDPQRLWEKFRVQAKILFKFNIGNYSMCCTWKCQSERTIMGHKSIFLKMLLFIKTKAVVVFEPGICGLDRIYTHWASKIYCQRLRYRQFHGGLKSLCFKVLIRLDLAPIWSTFTKLIIGEIGLIITTNLFFKYICWKTVLP